MSLDSSNLFFETPHEKARVFQNPTLVMMDENGTFLQTWENTQPIYFYPFSWLDYLNGKGLRELYVISPSDPKLKDALDLLDNGKVHFEGINTDSIREAKEKGHRVSLICNIEDIVDFAVPVLSSIDFIKIRVGADYDLSKIRRIPNPSLLSCVKMYLGEGVDYTGLIIQLRNIGFDFVHVSKRLVDYKNRPLSEAEREEVTKLKELETDKFKVIVPSSLADVYAEKFNISSSFNNDRNCYFSKHRAVLHKGRFYPCYTKVILNNQSFARDNLLVASKQYDECSDCACIYENDMLTSIKDTMKKFKNVRFALKYD